MSKILANQIANYGDNNPIELKEGLNIPSGKPLQVAGASGNSGQILSTTGTTVQWINNFSGSYNDLTGKPTIPAAQVNSDWNAVGTVAEILNKPIVPPLSSVTVNPVGTANLEFNSVNGQFTYTPPDLSVYALNTNVANWDAAYGWGDHGAVGYLTAEVDTLATVTGRGASTTSGITLNTSNLILDSATDQRIQHNVSGTETSKIIFRSAGAIDYYASNGMSFYATSGVSPVNRRLTLLPAGGVQVEYQSSVKLETTAAGVSISGDLSVSGTTDIDIEDLGNVDISGGLADQQILKWDSSTTSWKPANDLVGGVDGIALADLSVSTAAAGTAALSYNNTNGVFTFTPPDLSDYDTAFGWGDHSQAGYLTTETDPVFAASPAANITLTKINQWDTAYGWGNHANGGYLVATSQDKTNWNTAYGWGDHSQAGYLTAETDTLATVLGRGNTTSLDITTTGKIFYSNAFSLLTDLQAVSPATYHGMFAHAHDTGHGYVAHAGAWIQLLDTGSSLDELADVSITSPSLGDVLRYDGSNWEAANIGTVANAVISDTAPGSATAGDLWWESDTGRLKIYYNDTDSTQWVDATPPLADATSIGGSGTVSMKASLIPDTNDAYDIGSAEFKIRDLYVNDGSIHTESGNALSFHDGNLTWGGDDVIMLQDLKNMMATATSFEDFKNAIMGL